MPKLASPRIKIIENCNDLNWAERGNYWSEQLNSKKLVRGRKPRFLHEPLILGGHGVSLRVHYGTLLIKNGFTHHPQTIEEFRFFPNDRRLPSRIVIVDGKGNITFDAMQWLSRHNVPLIYLNWQGEVISAIGNSGCIANPELIRAQITAREGSSRFKFANWLILEKIKNSMLMIEKTFSPSPAAELSLMRLKLVENQIRKNPPKSKSVLLNLEARAATAYFICWHSYPLKWKNLGKKPIPSDWHRIGPRMATHSGNQFARHPVNAMLNYAYGILENRIRELVISMGFDQTLGFIHARNRQAPNFIFDLMEPLRPIVDHEIIEFVKQHVFLPTDFILDKRGVCKLHPQFAKHIVRLMEDITEFDKPTKSTLSKLIN